MDNAFSNFATFDKSVDSLLKNLSFWCKLPTELRIMIWKFSIPLPRVVDVRYDYERDQYSTLHSRVPGLLYIDSVSRDIGLKVYASLFRTSNYPPNIYKPCSERTELDGPAPALEALTAPYNQSGWNPETRWSASNLDEIKRLVQALNQLEKEIRHKEEHEIPGSLNHLENITALIWDIIHCATF